MKIAVCCAMNQNRSMEAHKVLNEAGYNVDSYGTNHIIKIPGESIDKPNVYPFGTSYKEIYEDLTTKNKRFYDRIGMLGMLERNMKLKEKAENFFERTKDYDIILTAEEKCFSAIFEKQAPKYSSSFAFLINFDIKDTISDATTGASEMKHFLDLFQETKAENIQKKIKGALETYTARTGKLLLFTVINN
ncbi:RNA polymerase II subunit A C-terminal domain phosphatase SSU72 [Nosema granulosis]|uniref:RNA polymerase II subunit A C-terminal domain phosphatase SSU72 n=1 Tax=Nosema granulosis TaxID=83296 RepID=A0A9P6H329_9MICR|nr:RNA polymerase II subunit A C-terminal domain phosphatase SSU72 [Nosema granulosis]